MWFPKELTLSGRWVWNYTMNCLKEQRPECLKICSYLSNIVPCLRQEPQTLWFGWSRQPHLFWVCRTSPAGLAFLEFWCCYQTQLQFVSRVSGSALGKFWWLKGVSKIQWKKKKYDEQGRGIIFLKGLLVYLFMEIMCFVLFGLFCLYIWLHICMYVYTHI